MSAEDMSQGSSMIPPRRSAPTRAQDPRFASQAPTREFNFNSSASFNQSPGFGGQGQHPRRRVDRFKRESINYNDRMIRQGDSIIQLLKEIRDRLPPKVKRPATDEPVQPVEQIESLIPEQLIAGIEGDENETAEAGFDDEQGDEKQ